MYDYIINYQSLVNDVMITNATYLGTSVAIILGIGVSFYFFNLKPMQNELKAASSKLKEQEERIEKLLEKNEKLADELSIKSIQIDDEFSELKVELESLTDSTKKTISDEIASIERSVNINELLHKLNYSDIWEELKRPDKAIESCLETLDLEVNMPVAKRVAVQRLISVLERNGESLSAVSISTAKQELRKLQSEKNNDEKLKKLLDEALAKINSLEL